MVLKPCPIGFTLQHDRNLCDCSAVPLNHRITCDIVHRTIGRLSPTWIGYYDNSEHNGCAGGIIFHKHCPFDYHKPYNLNITTTIETFYQCTSNRVGILCGACQPGLSLVLGSSKCFHCSYFHLLLFFVFAIAGLVLTLLLVACNLTVSEGTVNGLIFYANIVQINSAAFFPATRSYFDRNTYNIIHSLVESRSGN